MCISNIADHLSNDSSIPRIINLMMFEVLQNVIYLTVYVTFWYWIGIWILQRFDMIDVRTAWTALLYDIQESWVFSLICQTVKNCKNLPISTKLFNIKGSQQCCWRHLPAAVYLLTIVSCCNIPSRLLKSPSLISELPMPGTVRPIQQRT